MRQLNFIAVSAGKMTQTRSHSRINTPDAGITDIARCTTATIVCEPANKLTCPPVMVR
jgi:hypothetical protein